jgi:hypothetical protein
MGDVICIKEEPLYRLFSTDENGKRKMKATGSLDFCRGALSILEQAHRPVCDWTIEEHDGKDPK